MTRRLRKMICLVCTGVFVLSILAVGQVFEKFPWNEGATIAEGDPVWPDSPPKEDDPVWPDSPSFADSDPVWPDGPLPQDDDPVWPDSPQLHL